MSTPLTLNPRVILQAGCILLGEVPVAYTREQSTGQRITRFRKDRGLTQKELADTLGVTQPVVSDYENNVIRIPGDVIAQIAAILAVSSDELLGLKTEKKGATGMTNRRLARRLQAIEQLSKRDQEALLRTIDAFISKA